MNQVNNPRLRNHPTQCSDYINAITKMQYETKHNRKEKKKENKNAQQLKSDPAINTTKINPK